VRVILLTPILAALAAAPARAVVTVAAELSRSRVAVDDQLVLSVTVTADQSSLPAPQLPPMPSFSLYESGRSQSLSFVNGKMSASVVYTYVLAPRAVGTFTIPPIRAPGAAKSTDPIDIEVFKGAPPPAAPAQPGPARGRASGRGARHPDFFITASFDRPRAFVNQQVTLSVRFHYAARLLGDSHYDAPKLTGFLSEDLPPVREGSTEIDGRSYLYSEIKTALFPVQTGRLVVGPATVRCQVPRGLPEQFQPDFFDRFFAMSSPQTLTLTTEPLALDVEPLPAGRPDEFTGIVGRITAKASVDRVEAKVGEAVTLTVTVAGSGNLKSVPDPKRPELAAVRFFTTESAAIVEKNSDRIGGSKTFRTVLVPRVSGELSLPPVEFSYFDPETRSYQRAATAPVVLNVAPGAPGAGGAVASESAPSLTTIASDIRYLKTHPESAPVSAALAAFAGAGPWHGAPCAVLLFAGTVAWRRRMRDADPRGRRLRQALRTASARLREAQALPPEQTERAAVLIDEALTLYAADKLGVPAGGLTLKAALEGFNALPKPPSAGTLERLKAAWEEADLRRFAPGAAGAGDPKRFAAETAALLKSLDEEVG